MNRIAVIAASAVVAAGIGAVVAVAVPHGSPPARAVAGVATSGPPGDNGKIIPSYVARLYRDGYTDVKLGVSQNSAYGCPDYAVGSDSDGDGYGELVIQCPNAGNASEAAMNLNGEVDGDLVIVTGPLTGL